MFSPTLVLLTQYLLNLDFSVRGVLGDVMVSPVTAPACCLHDCMTADILPGPPPPSLSQDTQTAELRWVILQCCKTVIAHSSSSSSSCGNTLILHWEQGKSVARLGMEARPPVQEMDGPGADNSFLSILHTGDCDTLTRDTWRTWPLG